MSSPTSSGLKRRLVDLIVVAVFATAIACTTQRDPSDVVARYVASWSLPDVEIRETLAGPDTAALVQRIGVLRPHLASPPSFEHAVERDHDVDGTVTLPLIGGVSVSLPISATVREGRVIAAPTALAAQLHTWAEVTVEGVYAEPGRLLDRVGGDLDLERDEALLAAVRPVFAARLGGGHSYVLRAGGNVIASVTARPSADVRLAIDGAVQRAAAGAVAGDGQRAIAVIDATSGHVLAFAGPAGHAGPIGSVIKVATVTAALMNGRRAEERIACPARDIVAERVVTNAAELGVGDVSLRRALALSCNTSFAKLGAELGGPRLRDAATALGFLELLPGTEGGDLRIGSGPAGAAAFAFGAQGAQANAVALATVAATVGAGGIRHSPTWEPIEKPGQQVVPGEIAAGVVAMMRDAVENGTAVEAAVPGASIAAKTGTPRRIVDGASVDDGVTIAYVEAAGRRLGVAAVVPEGGGGGRSAAPLIATLVHALVG